MVFSWCHHRLSFSVIMVVYLVATCFERDFVEHLWSPIASRAVTCWHMKKKKYEELSRILQQSPCFSCCEIRRLLTASLRVSPPLALWQLPGAAKPRDPESQGHARSPFITCFSRKIINFSTRWSCLSFVSTFCNHFVHNKIIINRYGMS